MALEKNIAEQKEQEFKLQNILKEGKDKVVSFNMAIFWYANVKS